ncbi:MAG: response regulator [Treponema sp.]|jgi:signal transduction histidine kinase/DNA-binding response OmpR family regulator/HPt (histidine-containing phosphotransfer) domain-containing protein|nr:response regulator [Treponema sp.]
MEIEQKYSSPFYRLFAESSVAMVVMDSHGAVLTANRRFNQLIKSLDISGIVLDEKGQPRSMREFLDLRDDSRFDAFFFKPLRGIPGELVFDTPVHREIDNPENIRWFKVHAWLIEKNEDAISAIQGPFIGLIVEDQTQAKEKAQQLLADRNVAEKAMEAKSRFLANMSHEIRTPIQTIIGMVELLQDTGLDREQAEYSGQVKFSAEVLLSLINDILDYSKIEAGKMDLEHIDFDLEETIEQAVEMIALEAHRKALEIALDIPPEANIIVRGDPNKFRQVVINLTKNAVKFTKEGSVTITARIKDHKLITVSVADTGIGVSEENRSRLFSTFMQADASTTRRFGGTGLGLAISRDLVELMLGSIEMTPNEGGGSVFSFTIPLEVSDVLPVPASPVTAGKKLRILVVDDRPETRRIIISRLKDIGFTDINAAPSGEMALAEMRIAAYKKRPYELCFIDSIMPVMDGWRLAAEIHNDDAISSTALILMVPHGMLGADTKMTLLKWFKAYINKPIRQRNLADTINMALDESTAELEELLPDDAENEGADFAGAKAANDPAPQGNAPKPLILIVEDHPVNQKLFALIMEKIGYPSILADDGLEALDKAAANPVALIFMDIQMPRMNGYEAVEILRTRDFKKPVIAVTASALQDERARCMKVGFDDILIKPFKRPDIEIMLRKWIGVRQDGDPAVALPVSADHRPASSPDIFDRADLMETFMNNAEAAKALLGKYLERTGIQIAAIPPLIEKEDWESARREAHTIKGSALTVGGRELGRAAGILELALRDADKKRAGAAMPPAVEAYTRFRAAVEKYLAED